MVEGEPVKLHIFPIVTQYEPRSRWSFKRPAHLLGLADWIGAVVHAELAGKTCVK